jgi:hypothetical protein
LIKYRKFGVLILSLMILPVFAVASVTALSEENDSIGDVPDLPLILHGGLDVNGEPVSEGSEIMAYYEGEIIAKSTVGEDGQYSLNLNLTPENYTNIGSMELYVNGDKASFEIPASQMEAIEDKTPGSIAAVDIVFSASSSDGDTSSGSSNDAKGEARVVKKDTAGSEAPENDEDSSEAGFAEEDEDGTVDAQGPVSQEGDDEGEDAEGAEGAEGTEDAGHSTVFTALVFIAALIGAFIVARR